MSTKRERPFWYLRRGRARVAAEVEEEIQSHLQMRIEELVARGLSAGEARREALRRFGDVDRASRYCREQDERKESVVQRTLMLQDLAQDVRISMRSLSKAPVLTLALLLTVGLGIGATTVIFAAVDAAFLRPLPYASPDRLVWIYTDSPPFEFRFSAVDYLALEEQQTQFERVAASTSRSMTFSDGVTAEVLQGRLVTWSYFGTMGIAPVIGRDFTTQDAAPGAPAAVIVSHGFWQQRLGGRRDIIGSTINLDGLPHSVIGVLPARVGPLERRQQLFLVAQFSTPERRGPFPYWVVGRLKDGVTHGAASSELRAINRRIFPLWQSSYQDEKATWGLKDLKTRLVGETTTTGGLALAAVALVWLIACVNASNLLVARVTSRRRELAVRAALGASRARLRRFLLVESALLAVGAALIGGTLAAIGLAPAREIAYQYFPLAQDLSFNTAVGGVLLLLTCASVLLFGAIPAIEGTRGPLDGSLRSAGRSSTGSRSTSRLRNTLVAAQFAISTPLLIVAALLLVSLNHLQHVDVGFDRTNIITASVRLPAGGYRDPDSRAGYWDELGRRLSAAPGVAAMAFADSLPPATAFNINNFDLEARPTPAGESQPATHWVAVTPDYFDVLQLARIEGRLLEEQDAGADSLRAIVVDRTWAERFFPGRSAVGQRLRSGGCTDCPWTTVVGVVSDVKYGGLDQEGQGTVYYVLTGQLSRFAVIRTGGNPRAVVPSLRQAAASLDPTVALYDVATAGDLVAQSLQAPTSLSWLIAAFAAVALVLSIVGIYGVMNYYVRQHEKEIGIRLALGGTARHILGLVTARGMAVVGAGLAVGMAIALASTRLLSTLLFGVAPTDVFTFALVGLSLLLVALTACLVPAGQAARTAPAAVLRQE